MAMFVMSLPFSDSLLFQIFPGSFAHQPENAGSAVFFWALLHFRQFLLRNQEHGEDCVKLTVAGVWTPAVTTVTERSPAITCFKKIAASYTTRLLVVLGILRGTHVGQHPVVEM